MDIWYFSLCFVSVFCVYQAVEVTEEPQSHVYNAPDNERLLNLLWRQSSVARRNTPPFNEHGSVKVDYGLGLIDVREIDVETGVVDLLVWERMAWQDNRLAWNSDEFTGLDELRVPVSMIWQPDFKTYNSFNTDEYEARGDALAVISHDGSVLHIPPNSKKIRCSMNEDASVASCKLKIGSWTFNGNQLDIDFYGDEEALDLSNFNVSPAVSGIANNEAKKNVKYYPCCPEPFPDITYKFDIMLAGGAGEK